MSGFRAAWCALFLAGALPLPALAADPVSYTVKIAPTGNAAIDTALASSSQLMALRTRAPAGSFALVARGRADAGRFHVVLDSFGFYQAKLTITIAGRDLDDPGLPDALDALPSGAATPVAVRVDRGPLFHLRRVTLDGAVPQDARQKFALAAGAPAAASDVLAAGGALLTALQEQGYALARVDPPNAVEIPEAQALDVSFHVMAGPRVDLGQITVTGLQRTNERYVRRRLLLHPGELYQPSKIETAREDLASTGVFSGVKISAATTLDSGGRIPLRIDVSERKLHAVSLDAAFSTDLGGSLGVTWSHRNLFGNAERLNLTAAATGLGGSASRGLGYTARAQLIKPDYYHRDQTLELDVSAIKQNLDSYDQTAEIVGALLTRKLSRRWNVSAGVTATRESIIQEGTTRSYTLLALPLTARYDNTDVPTPLEDPRMGCAPPCWQHRRNRYPGQAAPS